MPKSLTYIPSKEELYCKYVEEENSMDKVAEYFGISVGKVFSLIHNYGIPVRKPHQGFKGRTHSKETKQTISAFHKNKVVGEKTKKKMSEAKRIGGIGHKKIRKDGYIAIYFPDHPNSNKDGYILEHKLVMECLIGRHLKNDEVVHHINQKRDDNRKENLQLMTFKEHASFHMKERHKNKKEVIKYEQMDRNGSLNS